MECTDMERRILDMWPKFEDGEPVWIGDDVSGMDVRSFVFTESGVMVTNLTSVPAYGECRKYGEPFKRPAPKVLDADGVEVHLGDTVYESNGQSGIVIAVHPSTRCVDLRQDGCVACAMDAKRLTHTRPDSWERLERDADKGPCGYFGFKGEDCSICPAFNRDKPCVSAVCTDIVRRAKALAEKEAAR